MREVVGYIRVSTQDQGRSGLGLEAQRENIERFCQANDFTVVEWYSDTQSGKGDETDNFRPGLTAALAHARKLKGKVMIAKLDRLSREVAYISNLMKKQRTPFVACDLGPNADDFNLHIYAAFGQRERTFISERTRAALAAKRERGEKLGNPNLDAVRLLGHQRRAEIANDYAEKMLPTIQAFRGLGYSLRKTAAEMNKSGLVTQRCGRWSAMQVARVLDRQKQLAMKSEPATIKLMA
jgi:DNA invertase Pin-like site-specific DNA recombinase